MSNLLKEAIADAKAVRETALQNAKAVLEEAFTPKLQSMLASKLQQEMAGEDEEMLEAFESMEDDGDVMNEGESGYKSGAHTTDPQGASNEKSHGPSDQDTKSTRNINTSSEGPKAGGKLTPSNTDHSDVGPGKQIAASDQDTNSTPDVDTSSMVNISESEYMDDDDAELNEIIAELEGELEDEEMGDESLDMGDEEGEMDDFGDEEDDEEIDIELDDEESVDGEESAAPAVDDVAGDEEGEEIDLEEILAEMEIEIEDDSCDDEEKEAMVQENKALRAELDEYKKALGFMRGKLNEVNLLNSKLLFTNKVFKSYGLNNDQKMRVVEAFDRSRSVREVKLTYTNLCESFKIVNGNKKKSAITEGIASKAVKSTKPSAKTQQKQKQILAEGSDLASRFQKLAGIKK